MHYAKIQYYDIANGLGVRTSLFVSGCSRRCRGCFNEQAWDFHYGRPFDQTIEQEILQSLKPPYIAGLTLLGGEPMEKKNQRGLVDFVQRVKKEFSNKTIWCYTGYVYERDFIPGGSAYCEVTKNLLSCIDILVDGPFFQEKQDKRLRFCGSSNQRVLDLAASRKKGSIQFLSI